MRKIHHINNDDRIACRKGTDQDVSKWSVTTKVPNVTCLPCLRALGLNKIVFKASARTAKALITFPGGKTAECLMTDFEMKIDNAPVNLEKDDDPISFLGREPEPITCRMRLTEHGRDVIRDLIFNMALTK